MATRTSTQSGDWSNTATWGGSAVPGAGDIAVIIPGTTVTVSDARTVGSKASGIGHAIDVQGTNSTTYGTLIVSGTGVLTLRGFDTSSNRTGLIENFAHMTLQPGATLIQDIASDGQSSLSAQGILNAVGSTGSHITFDIPAANKNWNNTGSTVISGAFKTQYDVSRNLIVYSLSNIFISNAAGNALGSFGDSSLSFGTSTPANAVTTEVASLADIVSPGQYYVDYQNGIFFFYSAVALSFTVTASYKYLTSFNTGIDSTYNSTYCEAVFQYCDFNYQGSRQADQVVAINAWHKKTPTAGGVSQNFSCKNCTFNYSGKITNWSDITGGSGDVIAFSNNTINGFTDVNGYGGGITMNYGFGNSAYVDISNNNISCQTLFFRMVNSGDVFTLLNWTINSNVFHGQTFAAGLPDYSLFADGMMNGNFFLGYQGALDARMVDGFCGSLNHPAVISNNVFAFPLRIVNYGAYTTFSNNVCIKAYHHGVSSLGQANRNIVNVNIQKNIITTDYEDAGGIEFGYNNFYMLDNVTASQNTIFNITGTAAIALGDLGDGVLVNLLTACNITSNLVVSALNGVKRIADTSTNLYRLGLAVNDYNNLYGNTNDFVGFNQFSTFTDANGLYNIDGARNILGVVLFDPNYGPVSGKSLVLTYPSAHQPSLAWDGGTAVALRADNGTATGAVNTFLDYELADSTKSWTTDRSNAACPQGMWCVITAGTGAGQVNRVTNNTSTNLIMCLPWSVTPDSTSVYSLYKSEVQLFDSGASNYVRAGIDFRTLPVTAQTDTGIAITFHPLTQNPNFVDSTRNSVSYDIFLGGNGDDYDLLARMAANQTLITSSFLPYMRAGFTPQNLALAGAGYLGVDIGAVAITVPPTTTHGLVGGAGGGLLATGGGLIYN